MTNEKTSHAKKMAFVVAIVFLGLSGSANAYMFKTTENGKKVRWNNSKVQIVLDDSLGSIGSVDKVENLITAAVDEWVDMANLPVEFTFVWGHCETFGVSQNGKNENCISVRRDLEGNAMATSRVSYDGATGVIRDADIAIRHMPGQWKIDDSDDDANEHDCALGFRGAILHEVGHMLGLAHSEVQEAVMAPEITSAKKVQRLTLDDVDGAKVLYREMAPFQGESCSVVTVGGSSPFALFLWIVFLLAAGFLRLLPSNRTN